MTRKQGKILQKNNIIINKIQKNSKYEIQIVKKLTYIYINFYKIYKKHKNKKKL